MSDGDKLLVPEVVVPGKPLGRHQWHDPRNKEHAIRPLLSTLPRSRVRPWWNRPIFNQQGSSCTFQAAIGVLVSTPFRKDPTIRAALKLYDTEEERHQGYLDAQQGYDPWPGGEPDYEGSSTDAPFKLLRARGVIKAWKWIFTFQDLLDTVDYYGPVAMGTWWKDGMDNPDSKNRIYYRGDNRGGHAYDIEYVDHDDRHLIVPNSWGPDYGRRGRVYLPFQDAENALLDGGECCAVVL